MTPVDAVKMESVFVFSAAPSACFTDSTSCIPAFPVSAFALPLFTTTARNPLAGKRESQSMTGAARARLVVKQPAAEHGTSLATSARSFLCALIPACPPENLKPIGVGVGALIGAGVGAGTGAAVEPSHFNLGTPPWSDHQ